MKIYTQKQITKIENQSLNKIYNALYELHERDNSSPEGIVKDRHDEILDIALKHLNSKPTKNVYGWIVKGDLSQSFLGKEYKKSKRLH